MPPKSVAEVASLTVTPDLVWSPWPPFSGGAHAASAATTSPDAAVAARSRNAFMGETSGGQESGLATRRYTPCPVETLDFRGDVESAPPSESPASARRA